MLDSGQAWKTNLGHSSEPLSREPSPHQYQKAHQPSTEDSKSPTHQCLALTPVRALQQPQVRSATTIKEVHQVPNETPVPVNYVQTWRNELLEGMEHPRLVLLQLKLTLFNYMQYKIK